MSVYSSQYSNDFKIFIIREIKIEHNLHLAQETMDLYYLHYSTTFIFNFPDFRATTTYTYETTLVSLIGLEINGVTAAS